MKKGMMLVLLVVFIGSVQGTVTYFDAESGATGNTVDAVTGNVSSWELATSTSDDTLWKERNGAGATAEDDVFEASGHEDAVMLKTIMTGLNAGDSYLVYVYFGTNNLNSWSSWKIQAGLSDTSLAVFAPEEAGSVLITDTDNVDMYRVLVGVGIADVSGDLAVYIDNVVDGTQRCWYDGIGYEINYEAFNPSPADGSTVEVGDVVELSWNTGIGDVANHILYLSAPDDPNLITVTPVVIVDDDSGSASYTLPAELIQDSVYIWRVDQELTDTSVITGSVWSFTTLPADITPIVSIPDASDEIITWLGNLPETGLAGTVDDFGEGDLASVAWEIISGPGVSAATDMQMLDRAGYIGNIAGDPNLLRDWIGTDARNASIGTDTMTLTLSGLPAGTYSWTSYHHDAQDQTGLFDVTVNDSVASATTTGVDISSGTETVTTFVATIVSDGSDVTLVFTADWMFVMNGFELTGTGDPLMIDFNPDTATSVMPGYAEYFATHEDPATFTSQAYDAFGTIVTVTPTWGYAAAIVTDTTADMLAPTATFDAIATPYDTTGTYTIELTATDGAAQSSSDTLIVRVSADACAAAGLVAGFELNPYDSDGDCDVDLVDFAAFAAQWLDNVNLVGTLYL